MQIGIFLPEQPTKMLSLRKSKRNYKQQRTQRARQESSDDFKVAQFDIAVLCDNEDDWASTRFAQTHSQPVEARPSAVVADDKQPAVRRDERGAEQRKELFAEPVAVDALC